MTSTAIALDIGHRVPEGALVVRRKICENCGRDYRLCPSDDPKFCCSCSPTLKTAGNQLWRCWFCGTLRAWGMGQPEDKRPKLLRCCGVFCDQAKGAGRVTEHVFAKIV